VTVPRGVNNHAFGYIGILILNLPIFANWFLTQIEVQALRFTTLLRGFSHWKSTVKPIYQSTFAWVAATNNKDLSVVHIVVVKGIIILLDAFLKFFDIKLIYLMNLS
jgi:hypothetical protein